MAVTPPEGGWVVSATAAPGVSPREDAAPRASSGEAPAREALPSSSGRIRLFICDDAPLFCDLMRAAIAAEPGMILVGEARSGAECLEDIQEVQPDLVLLDLSMADDDRDGLWALPRIKASVPGCAVIVLSAFSEEWMGDRARAAGASDYIQKGTPLSHIMSAVRRIAATSGG